VAAVASQIYRYYRLADLRLKHQVKWVTLALALLPVSFFAPWFFQSSARSALVGSVASVLLPILLPLSLLAALFGRGLWQVYFTTQKRRVLTIGSGALALMLVSALLLAFGLETAKARQPLAFEPLPPSEHPRPMIIDTDMAPDDWIAILYLLQRPDVQVMAITVVGTGEAHCQPGVQNALRLVALSGKSNIPVACGRETPLQGEQVFPSAWRVQSDNLAGLQLPEGQNPAPDATAAGLLRSIPLDAPGKVTLVTLGPLTNLAEAIQENSDFLARVDQIYIMGGALEVLGNVGISGVGIENQVAEWNILSIRWPPDCAGIRRPSHLVPLDATNQVPARLEFFRRLEANRRTPEARFVYDVLASQLDFIASWLFFLGPLTAAIFVGKALDISRRAR
jgi:pyrimidine-specific ribonucleoside hydrolase